MDFNLNSVSLAIRTPLSKNIEAQIVPGMLESLAGYRTMLLFAVSCKIGALERNAY